MDIAAAAILVLLCGPRLLRLISLAQSLFSVFCVSYAVNIGVPPNLTSIVHGFKYVTGMDMSSLLSYLKPSVCFIFGVFFLFQWLLCGVKPRYDQKRWLAVPFLLVLLALHANALYSHPPRRFSPAFITEMAKRGKFEPQPRRSLKYRGYGATFILEAATGYVHEVQLSPSPCSPDGTESIPLPSVPDQISLVQVECLDFELLEMQVGGESVMPFLRSLLPDSVLLRLEGVKKLASANSDFEVFNGLNAMEDIVHYEYETSYPRSVIRCLKKSGRSLAAFHGLPASYMNLHVAYNLQGFDRYHALEAMRDSGIKPLPCWWAGVISDADLFAYAARQMPSGPFVQFCVTMNMHLPEYLDLITGKRLFTSSPRSAFLTLAHTTDAALREYVQAMPEGAMLILWGDHRSYDNNNSGDIPFLVYTKGQSFHYDGRDLPGLTRCKMFYYLRRLFGCSEASATSGTAWEPPRIAQGASCR